MPQSVLDILHQNDFSFSAEIIPPRNGTDFTEVFENIRRLKEAGFHFISVTHGAGGSLRGGTLPIAHYASSHENLTAIAHFTVRNVSREDIENQLIDHHYFGIHNILALRGDSPDGIDATFTPAPNGHQYAYELVEQIAAMNRGEYLVRKNFDPEGPYRKGMPTRFCIGVASYPEDPGAESIEYLAKKIEAGAHFSITQMIFDAKIFEEFYLKIVNKFGHSFPVLPGLRIPVSVKQLERMKNKFGIKVPGNLLNAMREAEPRGKEAMEKVGIEYMKTMIADIRRLGIRGAHLFIMGDPGLAIELKKNLS